MPSDGGTGAKHLRACSLTKHDHLSRSPPINCFVLLRVAKCWCGGQDTYARHGESTSCDYECSGNPDETCGGFNAVSVYSYPGRNSYEGCFADKKGDRIMELALTDAESMTWQVREAGGRRERGWLRLDSEHFCAPRTVYVYCRMHRQDIARYRFNRRHLKRPPCCLGPLLCRWAAFSSLSFLFTDVQGRVQGGVRRGVRRVPREHLLRSAVWARGEANVDKPEIRGKHAQTCSRTLSFLLSVPLSLPAGRGDCRRQVQGFRGGCAAAPEFIHRVHPVFAHTYTDSGSKWRRTRVA